MASSWPPDEFVCSVCLELLRDPATLPCGHTYCILCIKKHWDQGASTNCYSCPQCRKTFNPRPSLSISTVLHEVVKKLRVRSQQQTEPKPKTREEMLKFRCRLTLDLNTAYRHIGISDEDRKATLRAEVVDASVHPDRFLYWRQVLCRESLAGGPCYWEVEWTGQKVTVGVTYRELERAASDNSSRLGYNPFSWGLYWSGSAFSLWHNGKETPLAGPKANRIGIYLDQQEGLLAFYRVSDGKAELIHSLRENFTGPLFPGFRFWTGHVTITISELE
ncbi:E3 ubiquitin/ISG15 ligase TRIM25-like [Sardina pilchardus]|uniref:E3 ubiquitin/ISG15 ligase TRIM25-like n=1 Tax=Sardina pilchardus TaxID=27697 RepID=UPI002E0D451B